MKYKKLLLGILLMPLITIALVINSTLKVSASKVNAPSWITAINLSAQEVYEDDEGNKPIHNFNKNNIYYYEVNNQLKLSRSSYSYSDIHNADDLVGLKGTITVNLSNVPYKKLKVIKDNKVEFIEFKQNDISVINVNFDNVTWGELIFANDEDNKRPAITGKENFVTSVDEPKSVDYFKNYITAIDETDGDLTSKITVKSDNYTPNKLTLGRYSVIFSVQDNSNNESTLEVFVNVVDVTAPIINGNNTTVKISYTKVFNVASFKTTLTASDNYDVLSNADITIKSDAYSSKKTILGTYDIVFSVKDKSENEATFIKKVEVIDDVAPAISGPSTLTKPISTTLTISDIQSQLSAVDEKEGNKTSAIKVLTDNYSGHGNVKGSYKIVFEVADTKGNKATHEVTINVIDDIAPIFYIKDGVSIVLEADIKLTKEQITNLLLATNQIPVNTQSTFNYTIDNYSGNEETPGVYLMQLQSRSIDGSEFTHNFSITVLEEQDDDVVVDPDKDKDKDKDKDNKSDRNFFEKIIDGIVSFFQWVWKILVSIWKFLVSIFKGIGSIFK